MSNNPKMSAEEFLVTAPLYMQYSYPENLLSLRHLDMFCAECGKERNFKREISQKLQVEAINHWQILGDSRLQMAPHMISTQYIGIEEARAFVEGYDIGEGNTLPLTFICQSGELHRFTWLIRRIDHDSVVKVGQTFSIADTSPNWFVDYRKVMDPQDAKELNNASVCASHGLGFGAVVYLRRVFERLVIRTLCAHDIQPGKTMTDKIKQLRQQNFIDHDDDAPGKLFGFLSSGVHDSEVTEEECVDRFDDLIHIVEQLLLGLKTLSDKAALNARYKRLTTKK